MVKSLGELRSNKTFLSQSTHSWRGTAFKGCCTSLEKGEFDKLLLCRKNDNNIIK